jgi:hypothetical protein
MEWYNIANWQNNVADDIKNGKLNYDENLINAVLEVALQLAKFRAEFKPSRFFSSNSLDFAGKVELPKFPSKSNLDLPKVPKKYLNDAGEIDLSKVTGEDAREYFIKFLGMQLPIGIIRTTLR